MLGVPAFVIFLGYSVFYYGLDQIRGGNNGFLSLVIPGRYTNQTPDNGGQVVASAETATAAAASATPTGTSGGGALLDRNAGGPG